MEDDPEVRIRELERSLSDQAQASELTAPPSRGARGPSIGRRIRHGAGALAVPAAAAAIFFSGDLSRSDHPTPSREHTGSSERGSVVASDTTVALSPGPTAPPRSGEPINITGVGAVQNVACDGNTVMISGASNTVTITGTCTSLLISGIGNTVVLDSAAQIVASGFNNRVTYHSGNPEIVGADDSNTITRG